MRRQYPNYRPSGVEWLGQIPEHWEVRPFRRLLRESLKYGANEAADSDDPSLPRFIRITDIDNGGRLRDDTFRSLPFNVAMPYLLESGDLLFARSGSVGRTFLYDESCGACAYAGYLIRARLDWKRAIPAFISYFSSSRSYDSWIQTEAIQSTIENVNAERYSRMPIPVPPLDEQEAVVAFLDDQTAKIDTLVAKNRLLLERLSEYRTALITRTVTKGLPPEAAREAGLNPTPRLKPSGVEWLGDVPEHWDTWRISALACSGKESFTDGDWIELPYITNDGIRLIQTGNIGIGMYREQGFRYIDESAFDELHCTEVDPGDVLICRLADPVGRACRAPDLSVRMITSVDVCILKPSEECSPAYLTFLLSSKGYLSYVESLVRGGTRDRISRSMLGAIRVPNPPPEEQRAIAAFLDRQLERIDTLSSQVETAIERLQEYRTALITAAVTGKIDVREHERVKTGASRT